MGRNERARTALVRRPGPRLSEGIVTHHDRRPVDLGLAARQHAAYVAVLEEAGWEVREVPPADDLPDAVFVEDTAMIFGGAYAVLARPGAEERRPEVSGIEKALLELGLQMIEMEPPGTLDGGDVLQVGDTVYVGRSERTDHDGICELARLVGGCGRRVIPVEVSGCLHLKTAMSALPDGSLIGMPEHVDTSALPGLRVAPEPAGAHVLILGEGHLLLAESAPRTAEQLRSEGYRVTTVDIGEFEAVEGGVTCLSVLIDPA